MSLAAVRKGGGLRNGYLPGGRYPSAVGSFCSLLTPIKIPGIRFQTGWRFSLFKTWLRTKDGVYKHCAWDSSENWGVWLGKTCFLGPLRDGCRGPIRNIVTLTSVTSCQSMFPVSKKIFPGSQLRSRVFLSMKPSYRFHLLTKWIPCILTKKCTGKC